VRRVGGGDDGGGSAELVCVLYLRWGFVRAFKRACCVYIDNSVEIVLPYIVSWFTYISLPTVPTAPPASTPRPPPSRVAVLAAQRRRTGPSAPSRYRGVQKPLLATRALDTSTQILQPDAPEPSPSSPPRTNVPTPPLPAAPNISARTLRFLPTRHRASTESLVGRVMAQDSVN
jgi:hypothetical protein